MDKLKKMRERRNLSGAELAKKVGCSRITIWQYENNKRKPNPDMLRRLAIVLKCKIDDIV